VTERDDEYGTKESSLNDTAPFSQKIATNYCALARVDPAKGAESVTRNVTLDPGWTCTGTVLGLDGKPLAGARAFGVSGRRWWEEASKTAEFTVPQFNPNQPRNLLFLHLEKRLFGVAETPKQKGQTLRVQMEPAATVTGRLIDAEGRPRAGVALEVWFSPRGEEHGGRYPTEPFHTDAQGRFRIEPLVPGCKFGLEGGKAKLNFGDGLRAGQTKDLGDVRLKKEE